MATDGAEKASRHPLWLHVQHQACDLYSQCLVLHGSYINLVTCSDKFKQTYQVADLHLNPTLLK